MAATSLAVCEKLQAFELSGKLFIAADGHKPTPCHVVRVVPNPILIFPPQYTVGWEQPKPCIDVTTPYHVVGGPFALAAGQKSVTVSHLRDGKPYAEQLEIKAVHAALADGGGGDIPTPFLVAQGGAAGTVADTAKGYSASFSFDEAFKNALDNLPKRQPSHPDELVTVVVRNIGAEFGGFIGFHHMFVEVARSAV